MSFDSTPEAAVAATRTTKREQLLEGYLEHRLRWTVPVTQPMLLCSQIQRSGGTLLTRLFDGHPACFTHPSELRWGRPHPWPRIDLSGPLDADAILSEIGETWPRKFARFGYEKFSNWTKEHDPDATQRYPFMFDETLQRRIFAAALERGCHSQRDVLNAYLTALFNAWLDYQNLYRVPKSWVVAFEPRLILQDGGAASFFADYPDGLLVTIVREPGAWLSSFSRHKGREGTSASLRHWQEAVERSVGTYEERPDRVVVIIFEELVEHPEAVMRALCARMGIGFTDVLLEPTYNSMPVLSDSSHHLTTGIDTRVTGRHLDTLAAEDLDKVAGVTPIYRDLRDRFSALRRA